jgi:hypothetical protein
MGVDVPGTARIVIAAAVAMLGLVPPASSARSTQRPDYVQADGGPVAQAFGAAMAERILSDEFHKTRAWAVVTSAREMPGYACPKDLVVQLDMVTPFPVQPGAVSWIEHWRIRCDVTARRNFLAILETDSKLRMLQLAPGASLADPILQRDTARGVHMHAALGKPGGCDAQGVVIDTVVTRMPERPGTPWTEVWTVLQCEAKVPVTVRFAPAPSGGVTWSIASQPDRPAAAATAGCAAHRERFAALIGKSEPEARAALVKMGGILTIRSGGPGMPMTRDYRADRATLVVENGAVTSVVCG